VTTLERKKLQEGRKRTLSSINALSHVLAQADLVAGNTTPSVHEVEGNLSESETTEKNEIDTEISMSEHASAIKFKRR